MEANKMNRIERKKEEIKNRIMTVAMTLFIEQGFDETTVDQIALEADVAKGTIYNHFPEKEAIISEHIWRVIKEQGTEMSTVWHELPDTRVRLVAALQKSLEWMHINLNNDLYERYFTYKMSKVSQALKGIGPNVSSGFRTVLEDILELGKKTGELRPDLDSAFLAAQLEINYYVIAIYWVIHPEMSSIQESIDKSVDLFLNGAKDRVSDS